MQNSTCSTPAKFTAESDAGIEAAFKNTYIYRTHLKDDTIHLAVNNGKVTMTGTVADEGNKSLAQATLESLHGVSCVNNQLVTKAAANAESADTWMGRKVNLALLFHRNVNFTKTSVTVKDGICTLTGEASSLAQKELTGEYAADIDGVKQVHNHMSVAAASFLQKRSDAEKIDDASVTAQIRTALQSRRSTNGIAVKIVTRDGKVTLTGIATSAAEKSMLSKLTGDIHGVNSVDNLMTVSETCCK